MDFLPQHFYRPGQVLVGLSLEREPVTVELAEWHHYKALSREQLFDLFEAGAATTLPFLLAKATELSAADEDRAKALSTIRARLKEWAGTAKLCSKTGKGFKIERCLTEGAVVYVYGSLDDGVIRAASRAFIQEVIQEARRLQHQRSSHLCLFIDELKFLASDTIVKALATIAGFDAEIITAYQNFGDLLNPDDSHLDGRAVLQAVQVNSQIASKRAPGRARYAAHGLDPSAPPGSFGLASVSALRRPSAGLDRGRTRHQPRMPLIPTLHRSGPIPVARTACHGAGGE